MSGTEAPEFWNLSEADYDLLNALPVCGCGQPEIAYEAYRAVLAATPMSGGVGDWPTWDQRLEGIGGDERLFYVVAYVLDHIEATEHGGSVGGAWRTDKGERLLVLLDQYAVWEYEPQFCMAATLDGVPELVWSPS